MIYKCIRWLLRLLDKLNPLPAHKTKNVLFFPPTRVVLLMVWIPNPLPLDSTAS